MDLSYLINKVVEFNKDIEDMESYAEPGMRARVIKIEYRDTTRPDVADHIYRIHFDFSEFDEENKLFETSNYYDKNGSPCLTVREAGQYKPIDDIYFGSPELWPLENYFAPVDARSIELYERFKKSGEKSYLKWLEAQIHL